MILVGDVGNTQTVFGLFDGDQLVEHWRLTTDRNRTSDELAILIRRLLKDSGRPVEGVSAVALSSVVPSLCRTLERGLQKVFSTEPRFLTTSTCGIDLVVDEPHSVGADRIANTIGAYALVGGPCLVIDFGTATNFDLVGANGEFLGGAIAPEMEIAARSLIERAAQLHAVSLEPPKSVIGKTTTENLQAGIVLGFIDLVDGLIRRFKAEAPGIERVLATGGKADQFTENVASIDEHVPFLTLHGLRVWLARQV